MKTIISFFDTEHCSGRLLCEMACSLLQKRECFRDGSLIKVAIHPYLSVPMASVSMDCNCADGVLGHNLDAPFPIILFFRSGLCLHIGIIVIAVSIKVIVIHFELK